MVLYSFDGTRCSTVVEVRYCCSIVISSAMGGFIIRDDSVGEVPVTEGNPARVGTAGLVGFSEDVLSACRARFGGLKALPLATTSSSTTKFVV